MDNGSSDSDSIDVFNFYVYGQVKIIGSGISGNVSCNNFDPKLWDDGDE